MAGARATERDHTPARAPSARAPNPLHAGLTMLLRLSSIKQSTCASHVRDGNDIISNHIAAAAGDARCARARLCATVSRARPCYRSNWARPPHSGASCHRLHPLPHQNPSTADRSSGATRNETTPPQPPAPPPGRQTRSRPSSAGVFQLLHTGQSNLWTSTPLKHLAQIDRVSGLDTREPRAPSSQASSFWAQGLSLPDKEKPPAPGSSRKGRTAGPHATL